MPAFCDETMSRRSDGGVRDTFQLDEELNEDLGASGREDLTDDILLTVFRILATSHAPEAQAASPQAAGRHFTWFRRVLPLVCRRWSNLLGGGGKYGWESVVVSVESEVARRKRPEGGLVATSTGHGGSSSAVPGSSPSCGSSMLQFARASLGPLATLRGASVVSWADARGGGMQHLLLDFGGAQHDFGAHALEALLRAANRGPRGLRTLRLIGAAGVGGQDSYEVLARLRGLVELHVSGLPQGFLAGTLPFLSPLTALTRLSFTPEAFQFPVTVPALPRNLRALTLSQIWLSRLPPLPSCAPQLTELALLRCCLQEGSLAALAGAPALQVLRLDGSGLTTPGGGRLGWEAGGQWPSAPCPALRCLHLAGCSLREVPGAALTAFAPALQLLDLSNNPDLGGASSVPDAQAAAASAACLPPALALLPGLAEVRLAGCGLTALPSALLRCTALTALDLSSNSLSALPLPPPPGAASPAKAAAPPPHHSAAAAAPMLGVAHMLVPPGGFGAYAGGGGAGQLAAGSRGFAEQLVRLNIATNRFTVWPQGLASCVRLRELVLGSPLLARAAEGELERCVAALPRLARLEVRGASFEPRAVRSLLAVTRRAAGQGGRPAVEVTGLQQ